MNLIKRLIKMRIVRDPEWSEKRERLKERIAMLATDDPLFPLLLELLNEFAVTEIDASCKALIGDEEAHRARGRLGMCVDLQEALNGLWRESRRPIERKPE